MKLKLKDGNEIVLPTEERAAARYLADLFVNKGRPADQDALVDWSDVYGIMSGRQTDAIQSSEIRPLLASAMEILIREPAEPLMVITSLFEKVQAKGLTTQVLAGAVGAAMTAEDIPENGTYPEVSIQLGGALQTAVIGKSGIAVAFTDEALRYSTWDIMSLTLRQMGKALVRHKENKAVSFLHNIGTELFNNLTPTTSLFGVTTGRGIDLANGNGSLTADDLFKGMAHMAEEGFEPDVMLINPLFFYLFIQDPVLRGLVAAGSGGTWFNRGTGVSGPLDPWSNGSMGGQGPSMGNVITPANSPSGGTATGIAGREHGMTAAPNIPGYFGLPFRIVVSHSVPFDAASQLGNIYLIKSGEVGYYLEDEPATTISWRDEAVETVKVKTRERYGFAIKNQGQGVGVFKNVKLARNWFDGVIHAQSNEVDSEIPAGTPVV